MAITSPSMGLRIWNGLSDPYDHGQLADNLSKLDFHDHTPGRGVQIPSEGLADASITHDKLSADVGGAFTSWKPLRQTHVGSAGASLAAGLYVIPFVNAALATLPRDVAGNIFYLDPGDHLVSGRTTQFRLRASLVTNAVAPGTNFTFTLHKVTGWGGAAGAAPTVTALDAASVTSTAVTTPAANARPAVTSPAVTLTEGWYVIAVTTNAASAVNSNTMVQATLQMRQN